MKGYFLLGVLLTCSLITSIAVTEASAEAENNSDSSVTEEVQSKPSSNSEIPVVDVTLWRTGKFKFPWSQPVMVDDDFDGKYLAVLDRERNKGLGIGAEAGFITEWSKKRIKVNYYYSVQQVFAKPKMSIGYAEKIDLKVGDSLFQLEGNGGIYEVTDEIAQALANAPYEPVKMRIYPSEHEGNDYFTAINDETIIEIKPQTIDAWKVVYGDKEVASE